MHYYFEFGTTQQAASASLSFLSSSITSGNVVSLPCFDGAVDPSPAFFPGHKPAFFQTLPNVSYSVNSGSQTLDVPVFGGSLAFAFGTATVTLVVSTLHFDVNLTTGYSESPGSTSSIGSFKLKKINEEIPCFWQGRAPSRKAGSAGE